ncbi:MAG: type II toxin-antitoxin system VapC family toxin [Thermoanaerobaculia bacterium]
MNRRPVHAFDSALWIYWIQESEKFLPAVAPLMRDLREGRIAVVTSVLSQVEVLTRAFAKGDDVLARRYRDFFENTDGIAVLDVDQEIAEGAARLRARYALRTPDAIHLSTALAARASAFVTTDRRLARIREIEVRVLRPVTPRARPRK